MQTRGGGGQKTRKVCRHHLNCYSAVQTEHQQLHSILLITRRSEPASTHAISKIRPGVWDLSTTAARVKQMVMVLILKSLKRITWNWLIGFRLCVPLMVLWMPFFSSVPLSTYTHQVGQWVMFCCQTASPSPRLSSRPPNNNPSSHAIFSISTLYQVKFRVGKSVPSANPPYKQDHLLSGRLI